MGQVVSMAQYRAKLFKGEVFLAIEDNHTDLGVLKHIVESRGGVFFSACTLEEAEAILGHVSVSVLTLDLNLDGEASGFHLLSKLRVNLGKRFNPKQIVIISGHVVDECEIGQVTALPKPIVPEMLIKHFKPKSYCESA